jgi:hypothetical protein
MIRSFAELKSVWQKRGKKNSLIAFGIVGCLAIGALGTTLAANINLNSGANVEFGQGVARTTACTGGDSLTITPHSEFINEVGAGAHYFTSITVTDIPSSCNGAAFTFAAYGQSGKMAWSDCLDPGYELSVLFTETQTVPTSRSWETMYSNVTNSNSNSFSLTWVGGIPGCLSEILANDVQSITIQSSGNVSGAAAYIADYTPGSTSYDPAPFVSVDAISSLPSGTTWANEGQINTTGDLTLNSAPYSYDAGQANPYISLVDNHFTGNIGSADSADRVTVEMWVNFANFSGYFPTNLFSFNTNDQRGNMYGCGYSLAFNNGYLGINTCNDDLLGFSTSGMQNQWHHIVWIASSGDRNTQKIYLDGTLQNLNFGGNAGNTFERARPNITTGNFGVNNWDGLEMYVGALKIYEGEMPPSTVQTKANAFRARLS